MVDFYEKKMLNILEHGKSNSDDADDDVDHWEDVISSPRSMSPENDVDDVLESLSADRYVADITLSRLFSLESEKYAFEVISGAAYLSRLVWPPSLVKRESLEQQCVGTENNASNSRKLCVVETFLEDPAMYRSRNFQMPTLRDEAFSRSGDFHPSAWINIEATADSSLIGTKIEKTMIYPSTLSSDQLCSATAADVGSGTGNDSIIMPNLDSIELFCNNRGYSYDFCHTAQFPLSDMLKSVAIEKKNVSKPSVLVNIYSPHGALHKELIKNHSRDREAHANYNNSNSGGCEAGNIEVYNQINIPKNKFYQSSDDGGTMKNIHACTMTASDVSVTSCVITDSVKKQDESSIESNCVRLLIPKTLNDNSLNKFSRANDFCFSKRLKMSYSMHHSNGFGKSFPGTTPLNRRSLLEDINSYQSFKFGLRSNATDIKVGTLKSTRIFGSVDSLLSSTDSSQCSNWVDDHSIEETLELALENMSDLSDGNQSSLSTVSYGRIHTLSQRVKPVTFEQYAHMVNDAWTEKTTKIVNPIASAIPTGTYSVSHVATCAFVAATAQASSRSKRNSCLLTSSDLHGMPLSVSKTPFFISNLQYSTSNVVILDSKEQGIVASKFGNLPVAIVSPSIINPMPQRPLTNSHSLPASEIPTFSNGCSNHQVTSASNGLLTSLHGLPLLDLQASSGYFSNVSQIHSDRLRRSSSCEANIDDDEEDQRFSGTETSSDVFPNDNYDDSVFEFGNISHMNQKINLLNDSQPEVIQPPRRIKKNTNLESFSSLMNNLSVSSNTNNELSSAEQEYSTNDQTSDEDQEVSNFCSGLIHPHGFSFAASYLNGIERNSCADNYDNDNDSFSTVTSGPESDAIIESDVDPEGIKLDQYLIFTPLVQTQSVNKHKDNGFADQKYISRDNPSLDKSLRSPSRLENRLSKLYIYEYVEDEDTTGADGIDQSADVGGTTSNFFTHCNSLCTNDENNRADLGIVKQPVDSRKVQITTAVSDGRNTKSKENKRCHRKNLISSREASLDTDTFLSRLAKYQIVSTATTEVTEVPVADNLLSSRSSGINETVDRAIRDADICVELCACAQINDDIYRASSNSLDANMCALDTQLPVLNLSNESIVCLSLKEAQTYESLALKERRPVSC